MDFCKVSKFNKSLEQATNVNSQSTEYKIFPDLIKLDSLKV